MKRVGDLEINEDLDFQRTEWTVERFGWAAILLVVILAGVGLFGHGPISWTTASAADESIDVAYERFGRRGGVFELVIDAPATAAENSMWQIDFARAYLASFTVEAITPEPDSVEAVGGALRYTFVQGTPDAALQVTFTMLPKSLWRQSGTISLVGGEPVDLSHFFFP